MALALVFLLLPGAFAQGVPAEQILSRVTEEAEMLRQNAPKALAEETLEQRALRPPSRFRPRLGQAANAGDRPVMHTREIVSEYSVGSLRQSDSDNLMEFRQVVSVDGKPIQSRESARHALSLGLTSNEDRARKRMLEDFESHGLVGAVTDFGILLLQFTKQGMRELKVIPAGQTMIGPDAAVVFRYQQTTGAGGLLDFKNRKATRYPLKGTLIARASDGMPLRITATVHRIDGKHVFDDEATVDYTMTAHGFVGPASVVHRGFVDTQLVIENRFRYTTFRRFGADAEIKFTEVPDMPPAPSKP